MNSDRNYSTLIEEISKLLFQQDPDRFRSVIEILLNETMRLEREDALGVSPYERSPNRQGYANGFKDKTLATRMGNLNLKVPQTRNFEFYPRCLEKGNRSERALKLAVAEMYLQGVSTRKINAVTEKLCGLDISSTQVSRITKELEKELECFRNRPLGEFSYVVLDAIYLKVRYGGTVVDRACLIAYGVNVEGKREILGSSISASEAEIHWREFLQDLLKRGLKGVRLIISDDHPGLKAARRTVLPTVRWQRCQFHMACNAQDWAPKKVLKKEIGQAMKAIFGCPDIETALEMKERTAKRFESSAPRFVEWLENNIEEALTVYEFPEEHRRKIRTSNGIERLNREIKRRVRVSVMFPNEESALRLVDGVLSEIHEEWITNRQYLDMGPLFEMEQEKKTTKRRVA
jgi:putative transposase